MSKIKDVLVVGEFNNSLKVYTYAESFVKAFRSLGYNVSFFNCKRSYVPGLSYYKLPYHLRLLNDLFVNYLFRMNIKRQSLDLIFFLKADNIKPSTIRKTKTYNAITANFYPDNPFVFWNGNSNANVLSSLPLYDHFLIWSHELVPTLRMAGAKNPHYFPFAYDDEIFSRKDERACNFLYDVSFVGTWTGEREQWLSELCKNMPDLDLVIIGNLWEENLKEQSVLRDKLKSEAVYGKSLTNIFRNTKINLNFLRKQNKNNHNMRTFEIPACGGFVLHEASKEQANNEVSFSTVDELFAKIKFYLESEEKRKQIIEKSSKTVENFTLKKCLEKFMSDIKGSDYGLRG